MTRKAPLAGAVAALLVAGVPLVQAHGSWWRAHDRDADFDVWALDHTGHEVSTATRVGDPAQVLAAEVHWGGPGPGDVTITFRNANDDVVHRNRFLAAEVAHVEWYACPMPPGGAAELEVAQDYALEADGGMFVLSGVQRTSYCGNADDEADPFFFRQFSDYAGTYSAVEGPAAPHPACTGVVHFLLCLLFPPPDPFPQFSDEVPEGSQWLLHLHVRERDHGG